MTCNLRTSIVSVLATLVAMSPISACFQPSHDVPDPPDGSLVDASQFAGIRYVDAAVAPPCSPQTPSPLTSLVFRVRTTEYGGNFAPRNVGAIWIETAGGAFVRTLETWGVMQLKHLYRFQESSDGNTADAVTSATLLTHETHEAVWDFRDSWGCPVEQGSYALLVETTDHNYPGEWTSIPFELGAAPVEIEPNDTECFHDMLLTID